MRCRSSARQRTKEEQIAAFGNVSDGEMVPGGAAVLNGHLPRPSFVS